MNKVLLLLTFSSFLAMSETACTTSYKSTIRQGPTTSTPKVKSVPRYTPLKIIENTGNWFKVKGHNFTGWIFGSLISKNEKCMTLTRQKSLECTSHKNTIHRKVAYFEGFKVLKMKIGCNFVEDKYHQRFWISSVNAWPKSSTKLISFP